MKRGANGAIVVNAAILRKIETTIFPKDIVLLTEGSIRNAQRILKEARVALNKPPRVHITLRQFCEAFPEYDAVELAFRLLMFKRKEI